MSAALKSFLIGLYVLWRGKATTTTALESGLRRYAHRFEGQTLNIVCQRLRHTVYYERWYMFTKTYRTYKVAVVVVRDRDDTEWPGPMFEWPVAFYPETTPWFMVDTAYPYFQAINAYIDNVIEGIKEQTK